MVGHPSSGHQAESLDTGFPYSRTASVLEVLLSDQAVSAF
jgi:hypothetical protein